ncbi:flagellar biosynthesis protein FliQ [bacterium]|nr:flagellar biosynthesis protein FliQ [bacterium]MBU1637502.1 flagellar biosynthesis protein FliQ [bacterium]MBU1920410.1 flagellar biosynthesis protein FliQ [bacterium]RQV98027.1 MAG: flagellar biosynthetic protein FliQ [bacterium]
MTQELATYLTSHALMTALMVSAPMLIAGMVVGVLISMFQAVTQINEMTLSFVPKIVVTALALLLFVQWMASKLIDFMNYVFNLIPTIAS